MFSYAAGRGSASSETFCVARWVPPVRNANNLNTLYISYCFRLIILYYNIIVVIMIPALIDLPGAPWPVLPPGIHATSFLEIETRFAINAVRRDLFGGFLVGASSLIQAGCNLLYLDGSYVTGKPVPGDYDVCWEPAGVDPRLLEREFFDFTKLREAQKKKFKGEYWPVVRDPVTGYSFLDFFQNEEATGNRKGILSVRLNVNQNQQGGSP